MVGANCEGSLLGMLLLLHNVHKINIACLQISFFDNGNNLASFTKHFN